MSEINHTNKPNSKQKIMELTNAKTKIYADRPDNCNEKTENFFVISASLSAISAVSLAAAKPRNSFANRLKRHVE